MTDTDPKVNRFECAFLRDQVVVASELCGGGKAKLFGIAAAVQLGGFEGCHGHIGGGAGLLDLRKD